MSVDNNRAEIQQRVAAVLKRDLKLDASVNISQNMPLIGGEFDLDSLDVVMLIGSIEKEFGFKIPRDVDMPNIFANVGSVVDFLAAHAATQNAGGSDVAAPAVDLDALLAALPHGEPFRFVTRLTRVEPGVEAEGQWELTGNEAFFAGHFPRQPIVPGVLIGEALAQVSGLAAANRGDSPASNAPLAQGGLAQIDVRFKKAVAPPVVITLQSKLTRRVGTLVQFEVSAADPQGDVIAEGNLTLTLP